ncbi:hypothetical protein [Kaarinaea lacus]
MRNLIILLAVILAAFILRKLWRSSNVNAKQLARKLALYLAVAVLVILLLTGRLHWLFAVVAAALPFLQRLLPLLRYVPLMRNLYQRYQNTQSGSTSASGRQTSSVESRYLRMTLDHDSGELGGEILQGSLRGKLLQQLSLPQLLGLLNEFSDDNDSVALLQTYLDRVHNGWRDSARGAQQGDSYAPSAAMSETEALEILGLTVGASDDQVVEAHRRLMHKLHPDRGGSSYLAAKINLAKDFLLKRS